MKKIMILFPIMVLLYGCPDMGESIEYDYSIVNESGTTITLIPYVNGVKELQNSVTLQQNAVLNKKYTYTPPGAKGYSMSDLFTQSAIGTITHLEIIFNNDRRVVYEICTETNQCYNQPRNMFNPIYNDEEKEVYFITVEDYNNADLCEGNCN